MKRTLLFALATFTIATLTACSDANSPAPDVLAVGSLTSSGGAATVASQIIFHVSITGAAGDDTLLIDTLQNGDRGLDIVASGAEFQRGAARLSNSVNESIDRFVAFPAGGYGGTFITEAALFQGRPGNGLDFSGYTVTGVTYHVDSILVVSPGSNPNADGNWTDYYLRGTLIVFGRQN